jgi:hypothetical protein
VSDERKAIRIEVEYDDGYLICSTSSPVALSGATNAACRGQVMTDKFSAIERCINASYSRVGDAELARAELAAVRELLEAAEEMTDDGAGSNWLKRCVAACTKMGGLRVKLTGLISFIQNPQDQWADFHSLSPWHAFLQVAY